MSSYYILGSNRQHWNFSSCVCWWKFKYPSLYCDDDRLFCIFLLKQVWRKILGNFSIRKCSSILWLHMKEWLLNNIVPALDWPAKLPDINIIENAIKWFLLDEYQGYDQLDYHDDLKQTLINAWNGMQQDFINYLINSIRSWCRNAIMSKYGPTNIKLFYRVQNVRPLVICFVRIC